MIRRLLAATLGVLALTGCSAVTVPSFTAAASPITVTAPTAGDAAAALTQLAVKGRAPKTGYSRDQFGPAWTDNNDAPGGHNHCSTRDDILARDMPDEVLDSDGCEVLTGTLTDPYTGHVIAFARGPKTSIAVQIDHRVALSNAWQTGAQQLTARERIALANDPLNLQATDGPTNEAKKDGDAATWLPPQRAYWCAYTAAQVAVKARYRLWVTPPEHDAIADILATCPGQTLPA